MIPYSVYFVVPLLAQLAKNAQGHGRRRYWTTITRNKLMKNNASIMNRIRILTLVAFIIRYFVLAMKIISITVKLGRYLKKQLHTSKGT